MMRFARFIRSALEWYQRFVPSRVGNDGLRGTERRVQTLTYELTAGYRPPLTDHRLAEFEQMANKVEPRKWSRSNSSAAHRVA